MTAPQSSAIKLGVGLAAVPDRRPDRFWQWVDLCEREGIDSIWISDRVMGPQPSLEPITTFAAIAGRTRRMKFGPSVLVLPLRQPVLLAKEVATIDFLSCGRMLLAVGVGTDDEREWQACGVPKHERGGRADEAIVLMRRLWTEERVTFHGRYFQVEEIALQPKPVQQPVPIWIGGQTEAALRRAGTLGDGWLPSFVTPEEFAEGVAAIHRYEREAQRAIERDHFGTLLFYHVASRREEAIERAAAHLLRPARLRGASLDQPYYALGTVADVRNAVEQYIAVGATKFVMRPVGPVEQIAEQLEALGRDIIPYFTPPAART
ncbi:MAG: LLM class flavin-dependent oxidoreductase [Chloroflexota bacterium]|nr:LLM class flavin-dependent oxidoreductase [Dehalococcoidia bacterium]MDW8255263.1 LLM class flavin-dependent oxidoreductase [Chloroflexota bacterium]